MTTVSTIEGIGPRYEKALDDVGIRTVEKLLTAGAATKDRRSLAEETGIDEGRLLEFVNRADLMRVSGVSKQYSDLLEAAGVDTVKELRRRNAANLTAAMEETNGRRKNKLVKRTPSEKVVQKWIDAAGELEPMVTH